MGRLTLKMLLSCAQFEREVAAERIRDKLTASKKKGLWMGGNVPLGYEPDGRTLKAKEPDAETIRTIYDLYKKYGAVREVKEQADRLGLQTAIRTLSSGRMKGVRLSVLVTSITPSPIRSTLAAFAIRQKCIPVSTHHSLSQSLGMRYKIS